MPKWTPHKSARPLLLVTLALPRRRPLACCLLYLSLHVQPFLIFTHAADAVHHARTPHNTRARRDFNFFSRLLPCMQSREAQGGKGCHIIEVLELAVVGSVRQTGFRTSVLIPSVERILLQGAALAGVCRVLQLAGQARHCS
jgi:hypothetical protein